MRVVPRQPDQSAPADVAGVHDQPEPLVGREPRSRIVGVADRQVGEGEYAQIGEHVPEPLHQVVALGYAHVQQQLGDLPRGPASRSNTASSWNLLTSTEAMMVSRFDNGLPAT